MKRYILFITFISFILIMISSICLAQNTQENRAGSLDLNAIQILDLKTAGKIALKGNPSLAAAQARVRQAKERVLQARSAYWPRLDARASASRVSLSDNDYQDNLAFARLFTPNAFIDDPQELIKIS